MATKRASKKTPSGRSGSDRSSTLGKANFVRPVETLKRTLPKSLSRETQHFVFSVDMITLPVDRLRLLLRAPQERSQCRINWGVLALAVTLFIGCLTADFHDRFGIPASFWRVIVYILLGLSLLFLGVSLAPLSRRNSPGKVADGLIDDLKSTCKVTHEEST